MYRLLNAAEATAATETAANANPFVGMGDMLSLLLLLMLFGSGIYAIYTYIRLHKTCMLFPNKFLYPGGCTPDTCADVDGFIDYIEPRLLLLGIAMILCGVGYLAYSIALKATNTLVDIATILVPAGIFVWYMFVQRKASKEFW
ncbi:MAG: hypothetical protein IJJ99_04780 [Oscillospiraceae bacterium]|nr:hypothetical protein [Oscillospiraceae bacterium]